MPAKAPLGWDDVRRSDAWDVDGLVILGSESCRLVLVSALGGPVVAVGENGPLGENRLPIGSLSSVTGGAREFMKF